MPLLEGLHFDGVGPGDNSSDVRLTSERFPRLRTLVLTRTVAPQDISLYAQLQTLALYYCCHTLSFEGFLDALAASVQLEELTIHDTLSRFSSGEWTRGGPLPRRPPLLLPRLRRFTLDDRGTARTSRFLAHLHLQPSVVLIIGADLQESVPGDDPPDPGTANVSISALLPPNPSATLPSLAIATKISMIIQEGACELRYEYPNPTVAPGESFPLDVTLYLDLNRGQRGPFMGQGLDDLVRSFGRSPLMSLVVEGNHTYGTAAAWERVFRTFPLLEELDIGGYPPSDVAVVFRGLHAASSRPHGDSPVACPNLEDVSAQGIGTVETYEAMREWRHDRGVILKVLDLTCLHNQDASISEVRRAVVKDLRRAVESLHVSNSRKWGREQEENEVET